MTKKDQTSKIQTRMDDRSVRKTGHKPPPRKVENRKQKDAMQHKHPLVGKLQENPRNNALQKTQQKLERQKREDEPRESHQETPLRHGRGNKVRQTKQDILQERRKKTKDPQSKKRQDDKRTELETFLDWHREIPGKRQKRMGGKQQKKRRRGETSKNNQTNKETSTERQRPRRKQTESTRPNSSPKKRHCKNKTNPTLY